MKIPPNSRTDHGVAGFDGEPLSVVAKDCGLAYPTVTARYAHGDRGSNLVRERSHRGRRRIIEGKSFDGWSGWFAIRGEEVGTPTIAKDYYSGRKDGLTDPELVARWKKRWLPSLENSEKSA